MSCGGGGNRPGASLRGGISVGGWGWAVLDAEEADKCGSVFRV